MIRDDKHTRNFDKCPGALYGSMPNPDEGQLRGVITIAVGSIVPAIKFLNRRYDILATCDPKYGVTSPRGVMFKIAVKRQGQ